MNIKKNYLPSKRSFVQKFHVMDILSKANLLEKSGKKVYHLELGEPIPFIPKTVHLEINRLLKLNKSGYTPSNGIKGLREVISNYYKTKNIKINSEEVFITVGSSGAFLLTFLSCFDSGDTVAIFNPSYPAYKNILKSLNIKVLEIFSDPKNNFKINLENIKKYKKINGVIISSPNNPTGQVFNYEELKFIYSFCKKNKIALISDEIYHGIEFEGESFSMRTFGEETIIINSFSKFFCMPGWRLGWVIIPKKIRENFLKLAQNIFISSGNIAQFAAIKTFDCIQEYKKNTIIYKKNRNYIFEKLDETSWRQYTKSKGSFYTYINVSKFTEDSTQLVNKILTDSGVALTPGIDFDKKHGRKTLRLSFSSSFENIRKGMNLLKKWINENY